ncbi:hypothetical protein RIF29_12169 [Crotalaria pallida]|uniref:Protein EMBRYONIC FLOWER 1 n=1 Tax=Crotalaria pallida TaxID=3830 RepID=A0AAN9P0X9_CROPI
MGSYIQIDSICIDLTNSAGKRDVGKCEHFSIRGYVSEIRKKDWKTCWPFSVDESAEQPSLPPLDFAKYRCQCCQNCPQESAGKDIDKDDQTAFVCCTTQCRSDTNCNNAVVKSATQCRSDTNCNNAVVKPATLQDPLPDTLGRRGIDLNSNLSCVSDFVQFNNEKEKNVEAVLGRGIDLEIDSEDYLNPQVTGVSSTKACPGLIQEVHTSKRVAGCEGNEVSDVELAINHKGMDKSSADIYNGGTPSADNQCQEELIKACNVLGNSPCAIKANNTTNHTTGHHPLESVACNHTAPSGSKHNVVENDFQDHHLEKSTSLSRRRHRKVRLMTDLLSEKGDSKTEQITIQGSPSHETQAPSIFPSKADTRGDLTLTNMGQSRKRKFLRDEARRPADMCVQRVAIDDRKEDATKFKDVMAGTGLQDAMKGYWSKSEMERNHIMGKKSRKIKVTHNHMIPKSHQGPRRENEDTRDTADKAYASKTLHSRFAPGTLTGEGMDKFPFHSPRIENEFNMSKRKDKMPQTDGELDSLSCQKTDMLAEKSFVYSEGKIMSNMPVAIPIPSSQGVLSGKGGEEGLQLSLNSYSAAQVSNKKCIHQIENRLPFPLSLQEGTSNLHQLKRKDNEINVFGGLSIPSNHINAFSGKGVCHEETTGARNTEAVKSMEQPGVMKRYSEQTTEVSDQGTLDGIPMEIVELLAKNQYERCLPDVENKSSMMDKPTIRRNTPMTVSNTVAELSFLKKGQKEKHQGTHKKNNMAIRGENVKPSKRNPVHYFSPFNGSNLGMNNLCPPRSPFGFEVSQSQNIQFSQMGSTQLGSARKCKVSGEERGSSNVTLQAQGGCSLHKTILHPDDEASRIWASWTSNHVSLGYDVPKKVVSQPTSANMDIISLQSRALQKQSMRRDIDLNCPNLHVAGPEMLSRHAGPGTFNRVDGGYPFPRKHNEMEPHQNLRGSLDMYSNETIPAMHLLSLMDAGKQSRTTFNEGVNAQMFRRPSFHGDCSTKLEIGTSKSHSTLKRQSSDYYRSSYSSDKSGGSFLGSPTFAASSSTQHDMEFIRATGACYGRNSMEFGKKEKAKSSNSVMHNRVSKQFSCPHLETETPVQHKLEVRGTHETLLPVTVTLGNSCMVNRNPADFTIPETGNTYMINGENLKFEKSIPKKRPRIPTPHGCKQQRNLKGTKLNEHSKH